jgi:hypothetical protein
MPPEIVNEMDGCLLPLERRAACRGAPDRREFLATLRARP